MLMRERRFIQHDEPLPTIERRKIWMYIGFQVVGVAACVAISQTIAAIGAGHFFCSLYSSDRGMTWLLCLT